MRIRRHTSSRSYFYPYFLSTRTLIIIFVVSIACIATLNLSPSTFGAGLPTDRLDARDGPLTRSSNRRGAEIMEHDFSSNADMEGWGEDDDDDNDLDNGESDPETDTDSDGEMELMATQAAAAGERLEEGFEGVEGDEEEDEEDEDEEETEITGKQTDAAEEEEVEEDEEEERDGGDEENEGQKSAGEEEEGVDEDEEGEVLEVDAEEAAEEWDDNEDNDGDDEGGVDSNGESHYKAGAAGGASDKYHTVVTVSDGLYVQWQARMCYYWYMKTKNANPDSAMGGFTRLLHSGKPDEWMDEIPTVVVNPLPPELEKIADGYVVLNRPYGLLQWVQQYLDTIPEAYVLMAEPDHIFINPPPLWATPTTAAAFPFFYIEPTKKENADIITARYNPNRVPLSKFAPIGNSPVIISKQQIGPVVKLWTNLSMTIKQDKAADKQWGWVQEMYAWSIASAQVEPLVEYTLHDEFMIQPPWDSKLTNDEGAPVSIIHFTYGDDFNQKGEFTPGKIGRWHFDKRDFMAKYPPLNFPMPPRGCTNEAVKKIISCLNEASANLPGWGERAYSTAKEAKPYFGDEEKADEEEN